METKIQKRKVFKKNKKYVTYYINLPVRIIKKASWLRKQKVVDVEVILGRVIIKPE
ncbi:MAG: hypothetical protein HYT16_03430 [DPANN group archaeon]|nr:hypothetical protein [DPANN group archaeon]